jgi:hypothetical protein
MTTRRMIQHLLPALAHSALVAAEAGAQAAAYSDAAAGPDAAVAAAYHVRLTSAWPQTADADEACRNGGDEVVEGTLRRGVDGVYRGSLDRRTLILFCGAHGTSGAACELVLEGDGDVPHRCARRGVRRARRGGRAAVGAAGGLRVDGGGGGALAEAQLPPLRLAAIVPADGVSLRTSRAALSSRRPR